MKARIFRHKGQASLRKCSHLKRRKSRKELKKTRHLKK